MSYERRGGGATTRIPAPTQQEYERIVVDGDAKLLTDKAREIGESLAGSLTTAQIRNVFGTVRQIEMAWGPRATADQQRSAARQLILLKPKLAYQASRERDRAGGAMKSLADILGSAIDLVGDDRRRLQHFVDFFEAILAYHTAASK